MDKDKRITGKKFNILLISADLPYPLEDGIKIRAFHTIKEMLSAGHTVTLLTLSNDETNTKKLKSLLEIDIINFDLGRKSFKPILRIFYTLFSKYPFYMAYYYKKNIKMEIEIFIKNRNFDLIYIYDRSMLPYGIDFKLPKILDSVDSQSFNSISGFKSSENLFHKLYWYINYLKSRKIETKLYDFYDHIITISSRDTQQLQMFTRAEVDTLPSGIDLSYFNPICLKKIPNSIAFFGNLDAFSNQLGIKYFLKKIFPCVKETIPNVKLYIIGKNPPNEILDYHDSYNVIVTGYVEDIQVCIDKCEIIISPLKMASGLQTKIVAAMAMNKPIVSTKESVGDIINYIGKEDIIIAENEDTFASEIIKLLSDENYLCRIGRNGREIVLKRYSWESFGLQLDQIMKKVLETHIRSSNDKESFSNE